MQSANKCSDPNNIRWRKREGRQACPRQIHRFLEPCLLLLVHCRGIHGYELMDGLQEFGFDQNPIDMSTIYRALRNLDERGFVTSQWDTIHTGPARRIYQITEEGNRYLASWIDDLRETDRLLNHFLDTYDTHMKKHQ